MTVPERACERCGAAFTPKRSDARYCGDECRWAANRVKRAVRSDKPARKIATVMAIRPEVPLTWEPVIEPRRARETAESCPDCGTPLAASSRGTWRACGTCPRFVTPAAVAAPYEHGSQRQVVSQRERDLEALGLAGRKGIMLGQLRRLAEGGLDDESCLKAEWFANEVKSAASGRRLDELAALFAESGIRGRPVPVTAGYDYDDCDEDDDEDYRPAPSSPRLVIAPPPACEPDWQWALRELGWGVSIPLQRSTLCHITEHGARCDGESMHNIGSHYGALVFVCGPHYAILARTITAELRRRA